jgi:quercetin dioxygenase-like cupin family protein
VGRPILAAAAFQAAFPDTTPAFLHSARAHCHLHFIIGSVPEVSEVVNNVVAAQAAAPKLQDGVIELKHRTPVLEGGTAVYLHYNGPTDQLNAMCTGMCVLDPGATPHPPHRHPEEEIMIVSDGTGEIYCDGKTTLVGPGAIMYCAGNTEHGITNTGNVPMTFYWSKWLARGF